MFFFTGLEVRYFLGLQQLPEVICSGKHLRPELEVISIKVFQRSNTRVLGLAFPAQSSCYSYSEFSSCELKLGDSRASVIRTLVSYLEAGKATYIACNVSTYDRNAITKTYTWTILVRSHGEFNRLL